MSWRRTPRRFRAAPIVLLISLAGCATTGDKGQSLVPTQFQTRTGPYVVFTNYALPADDPVVKGLVALQSQFEETLGTKVDAVDQPIEVYVLNDRKMFEHFLQFYYPDLPPRRAFFIAQGPRRVVYTFKGDRLEEDIRHEATHALLHLAVGDVPLWLDEGLAEQFEVPESDGLNREHLARIPQDLSDGWVPDLARLEGLKTVRQMTPRDYRESWAWVHYMLFESSEGRAALLGYLGEIRNHGDIKPLSARFPAARPETRTALLKHLEKARAAAEPAKVAASEPTIRLQDGPIPIDPADPTPKKRSFFGRLFGRLIPGGSPNP
jgi:hypothetical protein